MGFLRLPPPPLFFFFFFFFFFFVVVFINLQSHPHPTEHRAKDCTCCKLCKQPGHFIAVRGGGVIYDIMKEGGGGYILYDILYFEKLKIRVSGLEDIMKEGGGGYIQ